MTTALENSPAILCREILAEARRQCGEILSAAKTEAESVLAEASAEAEKTRKAQLERAQAEATRKAETVWATVAGETARLRAARVEQLLRSLHGGTRHRLDAKHFDAREVTVALVAKAIGQMTGNDFALKISAADHAAFGQRLAAEVTRRANRSPLNLMVSPDATVTGGVIIQSADGLQAWDNRLSSRLERMWPELRRQLAAHLSFVGATEAAPQPSGGGK